MRAQLIVVTVAVLVLFLAAIYMNQPKPATPLGTAVTAIPAPKAPAPRHFARRARPTQKVIPPIEEPAIDNDETMAEPPPAATPSTEELVHQAEITAPVPSSEDPLNILKWDGGSAFNMPTDLAGNEDNIVCPAFIVSYGEAAALKVEHKAWGKNYEPTGCRRLSSDLAFRGK